MLFEEIINRQKASLKKENDPLKLSAQILKDFSENRLSDVSEIQNLQEMLRSSTEKMKLPRPTKPTFSSQLTQDSTKRTPANTTNTSDRKSICSKPISHGKLLGQISQLCRETGSVEKVFEMFTKRALNPSLVPPVPLLKNKPVGGSLTDRIPIKNRVKKLNLDALGKKGSPKEVKKGERTNKPGKVAYRSLNNNNIIRNKSFSNALSKALDTQRSEERKAKKKTFAGKRNKGKGKKEDEESSYGFLTSRSGKTGENKRRKDREDYFSTVKIKAKTDRLYKEKLKPSNFV